MSSLPPQIQAQVEAADAMLAGINEPGTPAAATEPTEPQTAAPEQVQQPQTPPQPEARSQDFEHKYKVLQGMYNKQGRDMQSMQQELAQMRAAIDAAQRTQQVQEQGQSAAQVEATTDDVDNFGRDTMEMVHRIAAQHVGRAAEAFRQAAEQLNARLVQVEQTVAGTATAVGATAEQAFFREVAASVPDWETINVEPGFVEWLNEIDPLLGNTRMSALTAAREALDAARVVFIFSTYKRERGSSAQSSDELAKQVSPRAAASAAPVATGGGTVSQRQIVQFYSDLRRGEYAGREQEAARLEEVFNQAIAEGRVTM